jgi:hypothetical protein
MQERKDADAYQESEFPMPPDEVPAPIVRLTLEEAFQTQPVNTQIFKSFLVARLMEHSARVENTLDYQVVIQDVGSPGMRSTIVRWMWSEGSIPAIPLAAQSEYITEAAAYAMAFATISHFTQAVLVSVAERGDRYDYVLEENGVRCGVEISGTQTEDRQMMRDRQIQKIRQLLANPKRWGGYVVIVGFARCEVWLSRHAPEETIP